MESRHKNILIAGLLVFVFIMAVGFAAYSQRLTINETSRVTTNWNVGFNSVSPSATCSGNDTVACGTVNGFTPQAKTITLSTKLTKPSDVVTYTVSVKNYGDVTAKIATGGIKLTPTNADSIITYTQNGLSVGQTLAAGATATFTITVTFPQTEGNIPASKLTNGLTLYIDWIQA